MIFCFVLCVTSAYTHTRARASNELTPYRPVGGLRRFGRTWCLSRYVGSDLENERQRYFLKVESCTRLHNVITHKSQTTMPFLPCERFISRMSLETNSHTPRSRILLQSWSRNCIQFVEAEAKIAVFTIVCHLSLSWARLI